MAFGDAADGRVAGHLRDEVEVEREQRGAQAHAGCGHRGLAAGVPGADDDDVVLFGVAHRSILEGCFVGVREYLVFVIKAVETR
jgi:hypothetical protein